MKRLMTLGALWCAIHTMLLAVPANPQRFVVTQPDGTTIGVRLAGDEYYHYLLDDQNQVVVKGEDGYLRVQEQMTYEKFLGRRAAARSRRAKRAPQVEGNDRYNPAPRGIVLVVSFSDVACQASTTQSSMSEMCNGDNYNYAGAYGSVKKYFQDQSNGTYTPVFDVYGPIPLSHTMAYYGGNDAEGSDMRPGVAVIEACQYADQTLGVDFTQYDSDNDGYVDFVYMIYAGHGENYYGVTTDAIWPHAWSVFGYSEDPVYVDGKILNGYACSAELEGGSGYSRCGIGTLCHEFGHVLGQPDYYDTEYGQNYENDLIPGLWSVMAGGSYHNGGKYPCNYTVYEKLQFGWCTPLHLNHAQDVTLAYNSNRYAYVSLDGLEKTVNSEEVVYYLENRQQLNWDTYLPGHGLMVWRVEYDPEKWYMNVPNNTAGEPNYIYVPADGTYEGGDSGDPYPGSRRVTSWDVPTTVYSLKDIAESGGDVSFRFIEGCDGYIVTVNAEHAQVEESQVSDCYPAHMPYSVTILPSKNYLISSIVVTMGGVTLTEGVDYTYLNDVLMIPSLDGATTIDVLTEKIPFYYDQCRYFFWQPDSAVIGSSLVLDDLNWTLSVEGSTYRGFDAGEKARGAQFGSRSTSPRGVTLVTNEMADCLIRSLHVVACTADGKGTLEVVLDDETLAKVNLSDNVKEYTFTNADEWHGALELRFANLSTALYIKKIFVHFADETENPSDLNAVEMVRPQGPIMGIYNAAGQLVDMQVENLPSGLYLIRRTDGVEKIIK